MSGRVLHLPHALEGACGKRGEARHNTKAGPSDGRRSCFPHLRTSLQVQSPWRKRCKKEPRSATPRGWKSTLAIVRRAPSGGYYTSSVLLDARFVTFPQQPTRLLR